VAGVHSSGVAPVLVGVLGLAPQSSSTRTMAVTPRRMDTCSAFSPAGSTTVSTTAGPYRSSACSTSAAVP
jgi:hypothetical protein